MESPKRIRLMEEEIEEERFLFLGSRYNLFCIDLKKTEEIYGSKCSELSFDPIVAEVVWSTHIHATSDFLPFGMSSTRFDFKAKAAASSSSSSSSGAALIRCSTSSTASDIFLIGGEIQPSWSPFCSKYHSNEMYKLVPEISNGDIKDIKIEVADPTLPRMKSGKSCPIVEEIEGNLYVLHTHIIHGSSDALPEIPFEMFDSKLGEWRTLPTPPFFAARSGTVIYAHTLIEHKLVVETSKECFTFDTAKEEWYCCPDDITGELINRLPMTVPSNLPCFGVGDRGQALYVGISLLIEPSAYLVSPDGSIFSTQSLRDVIYKDILPDPDSPLRKNVLIPLKSIEDNIMRMCACSIVASNELSSLAMAVSFFSAKISPSSQQHIYRMISGECPDIYDHPAYSSFLEVSVEKKFFFTAPQLDMFFNGPALLL